MSYSNGPKMITNGLVLCLDAANPRSYTNGNSVWNDLSNNGNNGTLTNGPTYNTESKGSIVFDGVDDYVSFLGGTFGYSPSTAGELSLEAWVYPTGPFTSYTNEPPITNLSGIFGQGYFGGAVGWGLGVVVRSDVGNCWTFQVRNYLNIVEATGTSSPFTIGSWYHLVGSFTRNNLSRLYVNGSLVSSISSTPLNNVDLTPTVNNAAVGRSTTYSSFQYGGRVGAVKLYNRPLSSDEIKQNYNATKGRYTL